MTWATLAYYYSANHKIPAVSNIGDVPALKEWIIKATNEGVALMLPVWATKWAAHEVDFADVVSAVDRNRPVPLGLFTNAEGSLEHVSDNHSVVGYGYNVLDDQHRQVFIYDVDHAGVQCVLYNDGSGTAERWHESCQDSPAPDPEGSWLGFWVEEPFASNFRNMNRIP